ncbi:MAG: 1-(5-phosphoribosyl)-5-[(5-phosphoribosylamino)methylideneamino]imidazole-4-carboxamide isomerase [Rikenellaceae bacterium]
MITVIPAIDIIDGECVRLTRGDYSQKSSYYKDPLEVALRYEDCGLKRLHLVDLDGAKSKEPVNLRVLERIATRTSLDIQLGGGIKSRDALRDVFNAGASRAICGSVAVTHPELFEQWLAEFGGSKIILGADTKDGKVAIGGWLESSEVGVEQIIERFAGAGLSQVICTDIAKDGMLQGPSTPLYISLQEQFKEIDITVSGGISSLQDIEILNEHNLRSVIVGKAIYEGRISFDDLRKLAEEVC